MSMFAAKYAYQRAAIVTLWPFIMEPNRHAWQQLEAEARQWQYDNLRPHGIIHEGINRRNP